MYSSSALETGSFEGGSDDWPQRRTLAAASPGQANAAPAGHGARSLLMEPSEWHPADMCDCTCIESPKSMADQQQFLNSPAATVLVRFHNQKRVDKAQFLLHLLRKSKLT